MVESIFAILPNKLADQLKKTSPQTLGGLEEIRIRINRPIEIMAKGMTHFLSYIVQAEDAFHLLNKLSRFSIYTLEEELKRGYVTIAGGHRIGLAGKVILEQGKVKAIRDIASFNIRIAREKIGVADRLVPAIFQNTWCHTMIIGPPQTGKTTLLRDIARIISTGFPDYQIPPLKVGIVDERSEIAGSVAGVPQLTFGPRVDVLDACPKVEGMMMLIRSMSPDVLIVDEIGKKEDGEAILEAVNAGVVLMMTTHGTSFADVSMRPSLKQIFEYGIFQRYIELSRQDGPGTVVNIKDMYGNQMMPKVSVT